METQYSNLLYNKVRWLSKDKSNQINPWRTGCLRPWLSKNQNRVRTVRLIDSHPEGYKTFFAPHERRGHCDGLDYGPRLIDECDAVLAVGGDGTFLLAASRVRSDDKPVIGFNSDPDHSEGFLCLDRAHSSGVKDVLNRLKEGSFSWMLRTRVRVTLKTKNYEPPVQLHDNKIFRPQDRTHQEQSGELMSRSSTGQPPFFPPHALALNEVFVGENLSAQVSYFELSTDGAVAGTKVKSSGMCICSGTGSSSWQLSMNRVTRHCVARVLRCAGPAPGPALAADPDACQRIADKHNSQLLFNPEDQIMCYTIRDLITGAVWPSPAGLVPRSFACSLRVRSYCRDARLVVDGGTSYPFNDGSEALFEIWPGDVLRTVVL